MAGLSFPHQLVITSTEVGHRKPNPAGFRLLAERLGVPCERLTFVGNERKDIEGGRAAGCRTALVWRSSEPAPRWGQDVVVSSLDQLGAPGAITDRPPS